MELFTKPVSLTVVVLTYNEARNLAACLKSVVGWAGEIFVVDSGSTDRTVAIAERYGARVVRHPFESHAKQWNWAFHNLPFSYDWVLCLDADHRVMPELKVEICGIFGVKREGASDHGLSTEEQEKLKGIAGFYIKRRQVFRGKWIRHGGYFPAQWDPKLGIHVT